VIVVPRHPDQDGRLSLAPNLVGREQAIRLCREVGGDRIGVYDVENREGVPVYVHAKVVVVDDVWASVGSDNLNRRSWSHDSEMACAVLDETRDPRPPHDPAGRGDGARTYARDLRLRLWHEHLDWDGGDEELLDPEAAPDAFRGRARALDDWDHAGRQGPRPPGRVRPHRPEHLSALTRTWAVPAYHAIYDPDGRTRRMRRAGIW
jgi:phosphatidylserine/phosphatidylglycerophosphate/cardiolipin synthase-like enzyme